MSSAGADPLSAYSTCMSACEACVLACNACIGGLRASDMSDSGPLLDATICVQACDLALHAMSQAGVMVPAACTACARCCESLARDCMLLSQPESRRCAQACYRAARECYRVAEFGNRVARKAPARRDVRSPAAAAGFCAANP